MTYDAQAFRKQAGARKGPEEYRWAAALLSAVDEAEMLRERLVRAVSKLEVQDAAVTRLQAALQETRIASP